MRLVNEVKLHAAAAAAADAAGGTASAASIDDVDEAGRPNSPAKVYVVYAAYTEEASKNVSVSMKKFTRSCHCLWHAKCLCLLLVAAFGGMQRQRICYALFALAVIIINCLSIPFDLCKLNISLSTSPKMSRKFAVVACYVYLVSI